MRRAIAGLLFGMVAAAATRYRSPDDLALSPDGKRLYMVCSGSDEVLAVDTAARTIAGRVAVGKTPRGIALSPDGKRFYVTNSWSDTVSEVDAASLQVLRTLPAGFEPTGVTVDAARNVLYVANRLSDDVSLIDLASGGDVRRFVAGRGASFVAASPDGAHIYVSHIYPQVDKFRTPPQSEITEVDAARQVVERRLALPDAAGMFHMALARDGRIGIAAEMRPRNLAPLAHVEHGWVIGNSLAVFGDGIGGVAQLPLDRMDDYPSLPFGVAIAPDGKRAYVSASGSNEILILDLAKLVAAARAAVTADIALGDGEPLTPERCGERLFYSSMYSFGHQFRWRNFTTESGLPDNRVYCVAVDGERVWAGTDNGLALYENGHWKSFTVADGLAHRAVLSLALDKRSHDLWIATMGGLSRYSAGRFDSFTQLTSGLPNDVVYGVTVQGDFVWVATAAGGARLNTRTHQWSLYNERNTPMYEIWTYGVSAAEDKVYYAVWGGGVLEYDVKTDRWKDYHDPDGENQIVLYKDQGLIHEITTSVSYAKGILWAATYFGVSRYDGRNRRNFLDKDSGLPSNFLNQVTSVDGTRTWFSTDKGLAYFDGERWATYRPALDAHAPEMLVRDAHSAVTRVPVQSAPAHHYIFGIDFQNDDIWVATAKGVSHGIRISPGDSEQ